MRNRDTAQGFHGVVVSTLDFESSGLGSTPGGIFLHMNFLLLTAFFVFPFKQIFTYSLMVMGNAMLVVCTNLPVVIL